MGIITSMTMIGPLLLDIARDLRLPLGQASVLAVVSAVPQALSSPFAGLLADRFRRRPMIVLSLAGSGLLALVAPIDPRASPRRRSEEHTSELHSRPHLVCRPLLEKKKHLYDHELN